MKKVIFLSVFNLMLILTSYGQTKLGVKIAPAFISSRINSTTGVEVDESGVAFRPMFGLVVDAPFSENYYFSTGIGYVSKKSSFSFSFNGGTISNTYNIQYLQIPITLKMLTNEVGLDKRIYFQFGPVAEINIHSEQTEQTQEDIVKDFNPMDVSLLFSLGLEYKLGTSTIFFGGISYQRGLINQVNEYIATPPFQISASDIPFKFDLWFLDLGFKF